MNILFILLNPAINNLLNTVFFVFTCLIVACYLTCLYLAVKSYKKQKIGPLIFFGLIVIIPPLYTAYSTIILPIKYKIELNQRVKFLSKLPRTPLLKQKERTVEIKHEGSNGFDDIRVLIDAGLLDSIIVGDDVYEADHGKHCIQNEDNYYDHDHLFSYRPRLIKFALARSAFRRCAKKKARTHEVANVHLYFDWGTEVSAGALCGRGDSLEVRSGKENHLIDYKEGLDQKITEYIPPLFFEQDCDDGYFDHSQFLAQVLGYTEISDIPLSDMTSKDMLESIRLLEDSGRVSDDESILLLLGQIPSTLDTSEFIRNFYPKGSVWPIHKAVEALEEGDSQLYPFLYTHKKDLLKVCRQRNLCDANNKLR